MFETDREFGLEISKTDLSKAITRLSQEQAYLELTEFYDIKFVEVAGNSVIVSGNVERMLLN